ncbi:MAG TPA: rod shape-determining protein MreD [Acidimicrobiales bacterium]|nr:rod shape-determining protein MreD [Acidimicrobiales bacterium]
MSPPGRARLRIAALAVLALLVQATVAADLRVAGAAPDLLLVVGLAAAIRGGAAHGVVVGFAAGLLGDLYASGTPVGLEALTFCLVGYGVGALRDNVLPAGRLLTPVLAFAATVAAVVVFVVLGDLVGQHQLVLAGRGALVRVTLVEAAWSALLAVPVSWAYARAGRGSAGVDRLGGRPEVLAAR